MDLNYKYSTQPGANTCPYGRGVCPELNFLKDNTMTQPNEFRLNTASLKLDQHTDSQRNQSGTEIRRMTVCGYKSVTTTFFQLVEGKWVPFKRETSSVN